MSSLLISHSSSIVLPKHEGCFPQVERGSAASVGGGVKNTQSLLPVLPDTGTEQEHVLLESVDID